MKRQLESTWITLLCKRVRLVHEQLPLLWDCDFMLGDALADGSRRYVLCEVNVSSVSPLSPSSVAPLVAAALRRLGQQDR